MLYLINQRSKELFERFGCEYVCQEYAQEEVKQSIENQEHEEGWLASALDPKTAQIATQLFGFEVPSIADFGEFVGATPDDVVVGLADNMDLGDDAIAIVTHNGSDGTNSVAFYKYTKWED